MQKSCETDLLLNPAHSTVEHTGFLTAACLSVACRPHLHAPRSASGAVIASALVREPDITSSIVRQASTNVRRIVALMSASSQDCNQGACETIPSKAHLI